MSDTSIAVRTTGLSLNDDEQVMHFDVGIWECGHIKDGISLRIGIHDWRCSWVISFADLERVYLAAKAERE